MIALQIPLITSIVEAHLMTSIEAQKATRRHGREFLLSPRASHQRCRTHSHTKALHSCGPTSTTFRLPPCAFSVANVTGSPCLSLSQNILPWKIQLVDVWHAFTGQRWP